MSVFTVPLHGATFSVPFLILRRKLEDVKKDLGKMILPRSMQKIRIFKMLLCKT